MEQRRVIAFVILSTLVLILFAPKQPPPEELAPPAAPAEAEKIVAAEVEDAGQPADQLPQAEVLDQENPQDQVDLKFVSLGSVAKDSPFRLLVTLTNQGAAVKRVELASERYRDLQDRRGYLGHLQLVSAPDGGLVAQAVGAGTPAAIAGLEREDRILSAASSSRTMTLESPGQLTELLDQSKPGKKLTLSVTRNRGKPFELVVTLTRRPLEVIRPETENVRLREEDLPANFPAPPSFRFTLEKLDANEIKKLTQEELTDLGIPHWDPRAEPELAGVELLESNWEIAAQDETSVTFRKRLSEHGLEVLKHYRLEPVPADELSNVNYPGYSLTLEIEIRNRGEEETNVAYRLDGPNGLPMEGWWYANKIGRSWGSVGIRDLVARFVGSKTVQLGPSEIATDEVEPLQGPPMAFIGVDAQYFSAVMLPQKQSLDEKWIDQARPVLLGPKPKQRSYDGRYANVTCRLISLPQKIAAGETMRHSYQIFAGPKRPELLVNYEACDSPQYNLSDLMYYGWFGGVAKLMLAVLHFFYGFVHNYGIAIVLLTVLVRSCMFPLSRKQAQSMAKMQLLKPEMDKLKEKYKNDMQKQSQAMQDLYKKHNINPLAGCLPMFVQLPIFLGLYRALMVDVELRQAPLISDSVRWASNLAAPDMLWNWTSVMPKFITSGEGFFGLGPYLNILPLVTVALFLVQQKMFMPEPANEQAALQQKIMKYMMLFMGLLFFKVASGLCLYFIASSIWGIAERKLLPAPTAPGQDKSSPPEKKSADARGTINGQVKGKKAKRKSKKKR